MKKTLLDDLASGMHTELMKQGSAKPNLVKAAECLHAALEILEKQGLTARADQVLKLLQKIAQTNDARSDVQKMPSMTAIMDAGMSQKWLERFKAGDLRAVARFNKVLRGLGCSDHQIGNIIGKDKVMSEDTADALLDPNRSIGKFQDWMSDPTQPVDPRNPQPGETISLRSLPNTAPGDTISFQSMKEKMPPSNDDLVFQSLAQKKPSRPDRISNHHTKGLTSKKILKNLETHGTPFNLADDMPPTLDMNNLKESDFDPEFSEFAELLKNDIGDSDDELFNMEIGDDSLEVSENEVPMEDFEDERD